MTKITEQAVKMAAKGNVWDLGNKILYDMCEKHPSHKDESEIIAKIWLIGRSYSAAIERRRGGKYDGDDFYGERVVPAIKKSDIDDWLVPLNAMGEVSTNNIEAILSVHFMVMELFQDISGMYKRSLASKYLHFHFPNLFFIYDSRAVNASSKITGRTRTPMYGSDTDAEYRKHCGRCLIIQKNVKSIYGIDLTPRQLDNLLLAP